MRTCLTTKECKLQVILILKRILCHEGKETKTKELQMKMTMRPTCKTSLNNKNKQNKIERNDKKKWDMMKNLENLNLNQIQRNPKKSSRLPNKLFETLKRTRKISANPKMIVLKKELQREKKNQKLKKTTAMIKRSRTKWEWLNNSKCYSKWWWINNNQNTDDERQQPLRSENHDLQQQNKDGRKPCRHQCLEDPCPPQIERNDKANEREMKSFSDKDTLRL